METVSARLDKGEFYTVLLIDGKQVKSYSNKYDLRKLVELGEVTIAQVIEKWAGGGKAVLNGQEFIYGKPRKSNVSGVVDNRHRNWRKRQR